MYTIEQLTQAGGSEWQKGDLHRVYFNHAEDLYGLKVNNYNSGNVQSATFRGETISNSEAKRIQNKLAGFKIWYDLTSGQFQYKLTDTVTEKMARYMVNTLQVEIEAVEA